VTEPLITPERVLDEAEQRGIEPYLSLLIEQHRLAWGWAPQHLIDDLELERRDPMPD
jgi:hypothetical protein